MHAAVDGLRSLLLGLDEACRSAEMDRDLSRDGIARRRVVLGKQAVAELRNFAPLKSAEKWAGEDLKALEKAMDSLPTAPTTFADVALAEEIRRCISSRSSPIDFVVKSIGDPRILGAVLHAPAALSGLSDAEYNLVKSRAKHEAHPEQIKGIERITKGLEELRQGVAAAERMIVARTEARLDDDSQPNSVREPSSGGTLAPAKVAKSVAQDA